MREILFRGKRVDNGEWIKGFYCQVADESDGGTKIKQTILVPTFLCQSGFKLLEVDPETVGQYTGLTDKNCVKVFEGDIVRIFDGEYFSGVVKYSNEQGSFTVDDTSLHYWVSDIAVIGNIHDNPDLLGGE